MSGFARVACRGAPRDLGLDQGRACASEIAALLGASARSPFARALTALRARAAEREIERDTLRFFPHMAERSAGLARGARAPRLALAALSALAERAPADALRIVRTPRGPCVARTVWSGALAVLRESAPDTDYRSLELVGPASVAPFVGVNQHGLAVAAVLLGNAAGECAAPATLLAQDCLQRFDRVEKALEWLERRPAGGRAQFALADASGAAAGYAFDGATRARIAPNETPLSPSTAERCCVVAADPSARTLGWTFADGSTGEAGIA
jgi:hypothetical protein